MAKKKTTKRNLYALLVGINQYLHTRPLKGCVEDVNEVKQFLSDQKEFKLHILTLTSDTKKKELLPSKANIIKHFETHFSKAKDGDVAFFYFAGHGVRESTSIAAFSRDEADGCLKTLACYDSTFKKGADMKGSTLASKEIRYLLHKVFQGKDVHTVLVTDSCHSEGNTRAIIVEDEEEEALGSRLIGAAPIGERAYTGFYFKDEISEAQLKKTQLNELIPLTNQIQLAACRAVEEAWEAKRPNGRAGGFFTMTLMDLLRRSGGNITYYELRNRANSLMRDMKSKPQTPQIFAGLFNPNDIYKTFLSGTPNKKPAYCNASYNEKEGWTIDLGAIHGIAVNTKKSPTPVEVYAVNKPKEVYQAEVSAVFPGYALIAFEGKSPAKNKKTIYRAKVEGAAMQPIKLWITGKEKVQAQKELEQQSGESENTYIKVVKSEKEAQYILRAEKKEYILTYPNDDKPLVKQIRLGSLEAKAGQAYKYLLQISRWEFLLQLHNPDTELHKDAPKKYEMYPVELKMFRKNAQGKERQIPLKNRRVELRLDQKAGNGKAFSEIRFELINHSDRPLYCSLVYLSTLFGANPGLLAGKVELLEKGKPLNSVGMRGSQYIKLARANHIDEFGWDYSRDCIKLLVSTSEFDPTALSLQPELPAPIKEDTDSSTRSLMFDEPAAPKATPPKEDWTTYTFEIYSSA